MTKKEKPLKILFCDICSYGNNPDYVKYTGLCHGCGKVLDDKAFFKYQMNKKLRLWRGKRMAQWGNYK